MILKFLIILFYFLLLNANYAYAYIDPVSLTAIYNIIGFIFSALLMLFTRTKKIFKFLFIQYYYVIYFLILICLFPNWIFFSNFKFIEIILILLVFSFISFLSLKLIVFFRSKNYNLYIFFISLIILFGIDDKIGLATLVNFFHIPSDLFRYGFYLFVLFIILIFIFLINLKIKNFVNIFFIIIIFFLINNLLYKHKLDDFIRYNEKITNKENAVNVNFSQKSKPSIVIILDEANGLLEQSKNDDYFLNSKETNKFIKEFYRDFEFKYYPNAYTIYPSTIYSISSLLNFNFKTGEEGNLKLNETIKINPDYLFSAQLNKIKLFSKFQNSKIYISQNFVLNLCADKKKFQECHTLNPYSRELKYIDNYRFDRLSYIFSRYNLNNSIFSYLLTRTLKNFKFIEVYDQRFVGKLTIEDTLNKLFIKSSEKKYDLLIAHIMSPHKPFYYDKNNCGYNKYKYSVFLKKHEVKKIQDIETRCTFFYLNGFMKNLKKNNLLDYYNIVLLSDHGSRNSKVEKKQLDWFSSIFAIRDGSGYQKINNKSSIQYLFSDFFNKFDENSKNFKSEDNIIFNLSNKQFEKIEF